MATIPQSKWLYHLTCVDNLPLILEQRGLLSKRSLAQAGIQYTSIAYPHVQDRRARRVVPCGPGGSLHDYVPYYFAPRSPMLYTIGRGNVRGYTKGQDAIIYLVTSVEAVIAAGLRFVFCDGHGIMAVTRFFDDLAHLDRVDWQIMRTRHWADTPEDMDRARRRQAEFLVCEFFPRELTLGIGVPNQNVRRKVERILGAADSTARVAVRPGWYY